MGGGEGRGEGRGVFLLQLVMCTSVLWVPVNFSSTFVKAYMSIKSVMWPGSINSVIKSTS